MDKQFDPARQNSESPAPGMAAVNTHNPGEEPVVQGNENDRRDSGEQERTALNSEKKEQEKQRGELSE